MKINNLSIFGFGPFRGEQKVDFSAFEGDVFLIDGMTGAGKSSILDAISYALYNDVARYDSKGATKIRSDYCGPTEKTQVILDFTQKENRYRVSRNPEYQGLRKNSDRPAVRPGDALLERFDTATGEWITMASRPRDVDVDLGRILPLSKEQFLQVILLAQNKFAEFLHSDSGERQKLLRALFRTKRFDAIEQELRVRKTKLETALGKVSDQAQSRSAAARLTILDAGLELDHSDTVPGSVLSVSRLDHFEKLVATIAGAADRELTTAGQKETAAQKAHTAIVEAKVRQEGLILARERLAVLESLSQTQAKNEIRLAAAERAEKARSALAARDDASSAITVAEEQSRVARFAWESHISDTEPESAAVSTAESPPKSTASALKAQVKALEKILIELGLADDLENSVTEGNTDVTTLATTLQELIEESALLDEQSMSLPGDIADLRSALDEISVKEIELVHAQATLETAHKRSVAATVAMTLSTEQDSALAQQAHATAESAAATNALAHLLNKQLSGYAATIASTLVEGQACTVCGSRTHPELALGDDADVVTSDDVAGARDAESRARSAQELAGTKVQRLAAELAQQQAIADGLTTDQALVAHSTAQDVVTELSVAVDSKASVVDALEHKVDRLASLTASTESTRLLIATTSTALSAGQQTLTTLTAQRDTARGGCVTIGERIASVDAHRRDTDAYLQAVVAADTAVASHTATQKMVVDVLSLNGFTTEEDCTVALLPDAELRELRDAIAEHKGDLKAQQERISQAAVDGITETPIDTEETATLLAEAKEALLEAQRLSLLASQRSASLAQHVSDARADDSANASLLKQSATVTMLSNLTAGADPNTYKMRLESFVLAAKLEEIVEAANKRLSSMTGERYELKHDDGLSGNLRTGLGITVLDNFTGRVRTAESLSGGETFLASLALALGLAEVVSAQAGGIRLDTLFIDEGFGALDSATLTVAMDTIQALRAGGRTIGLISHVEEMKEQIPHKLHVVKITDGSSMIKVEG